MFTILLILLKLLAFCIFCLKYVNIWAELYIYHIYSFQYRLWVLWTKMVGKPCIRILHMFSCSCDVKSSGCDISRFGLTVIDRLQLSTEVLNKQWEVDTKVYTVSDRALSKEQKLLSLPSYSRIMGDNRFCQNCFIRNYKAIHSWKGRWTGRDANWIRQYTFPLKKKVIYW